MTYERWHRTCGAISGPTVRTASLSVTLGGRRPQSLAFGDPCGAPGIDPAAPTRVRRMDAVNG